LSGTALLIDKSALVRLADSPDAPDWASRIERGLVRITTVGRLEIGYSARSAQDLQAGLRRPPVSAMPVEYLTPAIEDRAVQVLTELADRGRHRAPRYPTCSSPPAQNSPASSSCTSARIPTSLPASPANPPNDSTSPKPPSNRPAPGTTGHTRHHQPADLGRGTQRTVGFVLGPRGKVLISVY
jgi:predicted nucleic acid-binding protein